MPAFDITYTRKFTDEVIAATIEEAARIASIRLASVQGEPCLLSIYQQGYVAPAEGVKESPKKRAIDEVVNKFRRNVDKELG